MKPALYLRMVLLLCALLITSSAAHAQVRYAFVSMTGSDANNCYSATTACRTFQRAHDVVSDGGTVAALDSGGYGPLNITKSVTVTGEGVEAGLTVTGADVTGVTINTAGVVVRLRHLSITGLNTSGTSRGVNYLAGTALHIEHCNISGFSFHGVDAEAGNGRLYVSDSVIRNNGSIAIFIDTIFGAGSATIERTLLEQNLTGLVATGGKTTIRQSRIAGNSFGISAVNAGVEVTVDDCNISHNGTGISSIVGATVRVANSTITNNGTALSHVGGFILTRVPASNTVEGNTAPGTGFTGTYTAQ